MSDRLEWLKWRQGGLGGSDVAGILGLSPYSTPFSVWWSKVRPVDEHDDDAVKRRGRLLERAVCEWASDELGEQLLDGSIVEHPTMPWALGTPDGFTRMASGERAGLEAKTVRVFDPLEWGEPGTDAVPVHYRVQCLWYLALTGLEVWRLAAFAAVQEDWRIYEIRPDPEVVGRLLDKAGRWWRRHIVDNVAPAVDTSSATGRYLLERYSSPSDVMLDANDNDVRVLAQYRQASDTIEALTAFQKAMSVGLKVRIGDARGVQSDAHRAVWSRYDRERVDWASLRREHPELEQVIERYTTTEPAGRLLVTDRKV